MALTVRVRLLGDVRRHATGAGESFTRELLDIATAGDLLRDLGIPADEPVIVGVNGVLGSMDSPLADGDEVMLVSPMAGGDGT